MSESFEGPDRPAGLDAEVQWRRLDGRLWVGRSGQRTIGTIELGSRYVYVDAEGRPHAGRPTLREAQEQATGPIDVVAVGAPPSRPSAVRTRAVVDVALVALVGTLATGLIWSVGSLLFVQ